MVIMRGKSINIDQETTMAWKSAKPSTEEEANQPDEQEAPPIPSEDVAVRATQAEGKSMKKKHVVQKSKKSKAKASKKQLRSITEEDEIFNTTEGDAVAVEHNQDIPPADSVNSQSEGISVPPSVYMQSEDVAVPATQAEGKSVKKKHVVQKSKKSKAKASKKQLLSVTEEDQIFNTTEGDAVAEEHNQDILPADSVNSQSEGISVPPSVSMQLEDVAVPATQGEGKSVKKKHVVQKSKKSKAKASKKQSPSIKEEDEIFNTTEGDAVAEEHNQDIPPADSVNSQTEGISVPPSVSIQSEDVAVPATQAERKSVKKKHVIQKSKKSKAKASKKQLPSIKEEDEIFNTTEGDAVAEEHNQDIPPADSLNPQSEGISVPASVSTASDSRKTTTARKKKKKGDFVDYIPESVDTENQAQFEGEKQTRDKGKRKVDETDIPQPTKKSNTGISRLIDDSRIDRWNKFKNSVLIVEKKLNEDKFKEHEVDIMIENAGLKGVSQFAKRYIKPLVAEFYANLDKSITKELSDYHYQVYVRGQRVEFSPQAISEHLGLPFYPEIVGNGLGHERMSNLNHVITMITGGRLRIWPVSNEFEASFLNAEYSVFNKFALSNLMPSRGSQWIRTDRARMLYALVKGVPINVGQIIFDSVLFDGDLTKGAKSMCFPCLLTNLILQYPVKLTPADVVEPNVSNVLCISSKLLKGARAGLLAKEPPKIPEPPFVDEEDEPPKEADLSTAVRISALHVELFNLQYDIERKIDDRFAQLEKMIQDKLG